MLNDHQFAYHTLQVRDALSEVAGIERLRIGTEVPVIPVPFCLLALLSVFDRSSRILITEFFLTLVDSSSNMYVTSRLRREENLVPTDSSA